LRTILLILNAVSFNGIPFTSIDLYLDGIKRIAAWSKDNEVVLTIRCKPGASIIRLLDATLDIDAEELTRHLDATIEEHARDCDLCLMYELPSIDALHFLGNSIPIFNPIVIEHSPGQLALSHPQVMPAENLSTVLQRLDGFKSNPLSLYSFRDAQFLAYLGLFQSARALRVYL
jgi:hypothetical protein